MRIVIGLVLSVVLATTIAVAFFFNNEVPQAELIKRCAASRPEWNSYPEDIKGQIGAAPVAAWAGNLISVAVDKGSIYIEFQLEKPWAGYAAALPILVRDPLGQVFTSTATHQAGTIRTYIIPLSDERPLPWLEIQYPHRQQKIFLDNQGRWTAE